MDGWIDLGVSASRTTTRCTVHPTMRIDAAVPATRGQRQQAASMRLARAKRTDACPIMATGQQGFADTSLLPPPCCAVQLQQLHCCSVSHA